jgi:voltage-gated potassium channel Kch
MLETLQPGSFSFGTADQSTRLPFTYFSLVTLTTVGYGDVLPVSAGARALANLEALVGQIYMTVLVARLVGMQMSQPQSSDTPPS